VEKLVREEAERLDRRAECVQFKIKYKILSFADKIDKFFEAFNLTE
jgi:hypothetical protein